MCAIRKGVDQIWGWAKATSLLMQLKHAGVKGYCIAIQRRNQENDRREVQNPFIFFPYTLFYLHRIANPTLDLAILHH